MPRTTEEITAQVQSTLDKLEPLLNRTDADPRPVVLMTCGIAGLCRFSYEDYQDEANAVVLENLQSTLVEEERDVVLDRAFYAKADREEFKRLIEDLGGRWVLVYLDVVGGREELWRRIVERREKGLDADSAREIGEEVLRGFVEGFEVPKGEGEVVVRSGEVVLREGEVVEDS